MANKFSEEQRLNAIKLYQGGKSISEVSLVTGISSSYLKNLLKKHGVITRPSGFQNGNKSRSGKLHTLVSKNKISKRHKDSGHKPSKEAADKGRPKRWCSHKKDPVKYLINSYKSGAEKRNLSFELSRNEFEVFIQQNCHYCGAAPSERTVAPNCKLICNGIDRKNNKLGYLIDNCVASCKTCNVMKSTMNDQEFTDHCCKITSRFISGLVRFVNE